jgi:hypothetical protein
MPALPERVGCVVGIRIDDFCPARKGRRDLQFRDPSIGRPSEHDQSPAI